MDGSVSTLAPIFAATRITNSARDVFSGRGSPLTRGAVTGVGTLLGGMGHTLPFLNDLRTALWTAYAVVLELLVMAYIRYHFMVSPLGRTVVPVIVGGGIVLAVGIWLGTIGAPGG